MQEYHSLKEKRLFLLILSDESSGLRNPQIISATEFCHM